MGVDKGGTLVDDNPNSLVCVQCFIQFLALKSSMNMEERRLIFGLVFHKLAEIHSFVVVHPDDQNTGFAFKTETLFVAASNLTLRGADQHWTMYISPTSNLTTTSDIDTRIKKASAAFGSLLKPVFSNSNISNHAKRVVYIGLLVHEI